MTIKLKNNVVGYLATAINASDTGIVLQSGNGASFPSLGAGEYFYATLVSSGGTLEVVKATARSGDSMTVVRAQDGSSAAGFAAGSRVEMRVNAQSVLDVVDQVTASQVGFTPTGGIAATDVQAALAEVDSEKIAFTRLDDSDGSSLMGFLQAGTGAVERTAQAKMRDVVSVFDFMTAAQIADVAAGTGDVTAAIQAAVDYCFGSVSSPRGANSAYLNKALYFPAGRYRITSPIAFYAVWGAHIFGQGRMSTKITNAAGGNVFNMNGFGYSRIELLSLSTTGATAKVINLDWDGVAPASTQQVTLADLFIEKGTSGGGVGIDIGASGFQASEILIQNCFITTPGGVGVAVSNYNALNVGVVQGNFQNCAYGIRVYAGSCPLITGVSFQGSANYDIQIDNHANDGYFISACRTESRNFINNANNCPMLVAGCGQAWAGGGAAEFVRNSAVMIGCASNVGTNPSGQFSKRIGCTGSLTSGTSTVSFDFSTNRKGVQTVTSAVGVNLTLSQVTAGILIRAGAPGAPFTDNFPTAADFLQTVNLGGVSLGDLTAGGVFELRIINTTGQTQTIATADPNTTLVGNMTTAAGASHDFVIVVTGTGTTMTIYG